MSLGNTKDVFFTVKNTKVSLFSLLSYIIDWSSYSGLLFLFNLYRTRARPHYHEFGLDDDSYSHTYYNDMNVMVTNTLFIGLSLVLPIVQIILQFLFPKTIHPLRKLWNIHSGSLGLLCAQALQLVIVSLLKNAVGAPRPDIIHRCLPSSYALPPLGSLSNVSICSNRQLNVLNDGFRSFPSGHASTSFASATFSFLLIITKINLFDKKNFSWKILLSILPFIPSLQVSATGYADNRHFLGDLIAGAIIGISSGFIGYHIFFPWFLSPLAQSGHAFPPRRVLSGNFKANYWKISQEDEDTFGDDCISIDKVLLKSETTDTLSDILNLPLDLGKMKTLRDYNSKSRPHTGTSSFTARPNLPGETV